MTETIKTRLKQLDDLVRKWKDVGLRAQLTGPIEADALRITAEREQLLANRRHLMQLTKEFAKLEDQNEKLAKLGPLVKAFQNHVDEASRCLRSVEVARSGLHDVVKQLEDPAPVIEKLLQKHRNEIEESATLSEEVHRLRERQRDLEEELSELKNQEVTIAALREQVAELELNAAQEKQQAASDVSAEVAEVLRSWQQRENALRQENAALAAEARKMQRLYNDTSLHVSGVKQQLEHMMEQRDVESERSAERVQELEVQLAVARREAKHLQASVAHLQSSVEEAVQQKEDALEHLQQLQAQHQQQQQQQQSHYATPRGQLRSAATTDGNGGGEVASALESTITELHERLDVLESEKRQLLAENSRATEKFREQLTQMESWGNDARRQYETVREHLELSKKENLSLRRKLDEAADEARDLRGQILDLESTLSQMQQQQQSDPAGMILKNAARGSRPSTPTTELQQQQQQQQWVANSSGNNNNNNATLEAVASQRDSLKRRLMNLEEVSQREISLLKQEVSALRAERQNLLADARGGTSGANGMSDDNGVTVINVQTPMNLQQSAAVLSRAHNPPNLVDAAGNLIARFVTANPTTRRIFVGYLFSLHMFFFLWLALH